MKLKNIQYLLIVLISLSQLNTNAQITLATTLNTTSAEEGYVLFGYDQDSITYLIDECGRVVNSWNSSASSGKSSYLLEDGSFIRCTSTPTTSFSAGGIGGLIHRFDWDGNLLWSFLYSDSTHALHHDIAVLPNGNILAIAFELKTKQECIDAGRDTTLLTDNKLWPEKVIEIQPVGLDSAVIVWEWHMWDHLVQDFDITKPNYGVVAEHPELFNLNFINNPVADWAHANAIDYNADLDQIILSLNAFSEFVIIDHSTTTSEAASHAGGNMGKGGDLLYRYGNPQSYNHGDASDRVNFKQHNVHWIADSLTDGGKIMIYNNGNGRPSGNYSSIDIVNPLKDINGNYILEADTTFGPDTAEWSYVAPTPTDFYSQNISGAHRLPNGNTIICQGRDGRIFEIDANKDIVWEYWSPITNIGILSQGDTPSGNRGVFRATKYLPDYPAFNGRDMTPGQPIEQNPDLSNCLSVSVDELAEVQEYSIAPNPVNDILYIRYSPQNEIKRVEIYDLTGKIVYTEKASNYIDLSWLDKGIYIINVDGVAKKIIKQ